MCVQWIRTPATAYLRYLRQRGRDVTAGKRQTGVKDNIALSHIYSSPRTKNQALSISPRLLSRAVLYLIIYLYFIN
jgi:hypothetical protein